MNELLIGLDAKSKIPLYEQIYQFIRSEIQERQMLPGERLPSTRSLCKNLQVSRSTVELAYDQLLAEGYIESFPYKGYFVCELDGLCEIPTVQQETHEERNTTGKSYQYDFAVSGIDKDGFPHNTWRKISKEVLQDDSGALFRLGDPQGEQGLRDAVANYLHHARGVSCIPEQIVIGAGNDYLLMLLHVLLGPENIIGMENPTYKSAYQVFVNLGYQIKSVEMDQQGMSVDSLAVSDARVAYVMPAHQFPTGVIMPVKRRLQLLSWAANQDGRYIIEDDYDSEFRYRGKPIPALQGYDHNETVIYIGTFSKSIAPAIRISYMVLPSKLLAVYQEKGRDFSPTVSRVDQKIIEVFLRDGYYERHLNRMRTIYKNKHDVFLSKMKTLSSICVVSGENAGVHVVARFINGLTEERAVALAKENEIQVYGLSKYYISAGVVEDSGGVIMGYAMLSEEEIVEGIERLKEIWSL